MARSKKKTPKPSTAAFTSPLTSAHVTNPIDSDEDAPTERKRQKTYSSDNDNDDSDSNSSSGGSSNNGNKIQKKEQLLQILERKEAKRAKLEMEVEEEKRLTSMLFGNVNDMHNVDDNTGIGGGSAWNDEDEDEDDEDYNGDNGGYEEDVERNNASLFAIDRSGVSSQHHDNKDDDNHDDEDDDEDDGDDESSQEESQVDSDSNSNSSSSSSDEKNNHEETQAWIDEDDEEIAISLQHTSDRIKKLRTSISENMVDGKDYESRLRERFQSTSSSVARTDWANVNVNDNINDSDNLQSDTDHDDDVDDDDNDKKEKEGEKSASATKILSSTRSLLSSSSSKLQPHVLQIVRVPDANRTSYNHSTVNAVQFHPESDDDAPLLFTAGMDKALRFFKIGNDGLTSEKIHGVNFPNFPIYSASFLGNTGKVVLSSRRPFFYMYDTEAGKIDKIPRIDGRVERSLERFTASPDGTLIAFMGNDGYIILVEASSKMWVADLKMNGSVRALSFTPDNRYLMSSGSDGEIYRWDLKTMKCVDKYQNQDGSITSNISSTSKFLAVGAESGVVNLYKNSKADTYSNRFTARNPIKSIMNLQTSCDSMKFNPDGQILAMSTRREKDTMKLLHVPTQTVFSNWPTTKTPLSYVWSLDFSPSSKYMAVGNDKGKCLLYKLLHYHEG